MKLCCLHTCCLNECSNRIINLSPSIYFNKNFIPVWCKVKLHLKWYAFLVSMEGCKDTTAEKAHSLYMPNIPHYANHLIRSSIKFQQWNWFHTYIKAAQSQNLNVLPSMKNLKKCELKNGNLSILYSLQNIACKDLRVGFFLSLSLTVQWQTIKKDRETEGDYSGSNLQQQKWDLGQQKHCLWCLNLKTIWAET